MKRFKENIKLLAGVLIVPLMLIGLPVFMIQLEGTPAAINSLCYHGPNTKFACRWTDGKKALLENASGTTRLVSLQIMHGRFQSVVVGETYVVQPGIACRWGQLPGILRRV